MVNLKFLSKMQVTFDKQILGLVKSNEKGDFIDGDSSRMEPCNDSLLTKTRHSENIICKNMEMCIKMSQQLTQNTIDERSLVSALVTTTSAKDGRCIDSASNYRLKRSKNIKLEVCRKCKEVLKHIDRFYNNNDKKDVGPLQNVTESAPHNNVKLNNHSINLGIVNDQKKTCVDDKQNGQTYISCQSALRLDKFRHGISLNCGKSTSKNDPNNKNNDENQNEQIVSSNRTFETDNSIVACNKPVCSKFNSDAMCYFVDLDNACTSNDCPNKCAQPKAKPKHFCFRKKVNVGMDSDCCFKRSFYNRIRNFFNCITAKFRSRQNNQNIECGTPLKDARNQTKKLTINIKKEPVCIIFENGLKQSSKDKCPNGFGKLPKKKVAFRDRCVSLPKGLVAIKIDPNNKRIINKRELKSILKSLPKRDSKKSPVPSTSKVEVTTLLKPKSSPIASASKGPMFVLKIDRNNMRILNYQEVKCKINNLTKMCAKNPNCESWIVAKGKCGDNKQELRSVESKMSLWDRYHRSKSKSPCPPIKKKPSKGKLEKKSLSDFKLFSKVNRSEKKKPKSKSGSKITKYVRGNKSKKPKKKVAPKKKIVKKKSRTAKKPKRPKRKTKQKTVLHKKGKSKGLKKKKSNKKKTKKKKGKTRRRLKKGKRAFKKCCLLFKTEAECKRMKKKSAKLKKKKSKSKPLDCKNIEKPKGLERKLEKTQYNYLRHTKTPCLWLFVACPLLHRNYMMFRSIFHDFTRCMLLMLALIFWCPCFLCIELVRCFCT